MNSPRSVDNYFTEDYIRSAVHITSVLLRELLQFFSARNAVLSKKVARSPRKMKTSWATGLFVVFLAARLADSRPLGDVEDSVTHERVRRSDSILGEFAQDAGILNEGRKYLSTPADMQYPYAYYLHITSADVPLKDCKALRDEDTDGTLVSGLYKVFPGDSEGEFTTFCDMQLSDGTGGWTVIQRRVDGTTSFDRTWAEYMNGFGDLNGNFWLGLRKIQRITEMPGTYELFIGLMDKDGDVAFARYKSFYLAGPTYILMLGPLDESSTVTDDSLKEHNMQPFSTKDNDNDDYSGNCAQSFKGGWWYKHCLYVNLNGEYVASGVAPYNAGGIQWQHWDELGLGYKVAVATIMAVRRVS